MSVVGRMSPSDFMDACRKSGRLFGSYRFSGNEFNTSWEEFDDDPHDLGLDVTGLPDSLRTVFIGRLYNAIRSENWKDTYLDPRCPEIIARIMGVTEPVERYSREGVLIDANVFPNINLKDQESPMLKATSSCPICKEITSVTASFPWLFETTINREERSPPSKICFHCKPCDWYWHCPVKITLSVECPGE